MERYVITTDGIPMTRRIHVVALICVKTAAIIGRSVGSIRLPQGGSRMRLLKDASTGEMTSYGYLGKSLVFGFLLLSLRDLLAVIVLRLFQPSTAEKKASQQLLPLLL